MTIKTFWTIFIKILGIWLVLDSVSVIPQLMSSLFYTDPNGEGFLLSIALLLFTIGIYLFILRLFVFKTSWLIDKLHLERGFTEDRIDLNIQLSTILKVAIIVIGGLIFVNGLPQLCKQIYVFFQQKNIFRESPTSGAIILYLAKTIIGYLIMTNSKQIVAFIDVQTRKENSNNDD